MLNSRVFLHPARVVAYALFLMTAPYPAWTQSGGVQSNYAADEAENYRYMHEHAKKRSFYKLNLAEPHQYGYVMSMLKRGGATPATHPNLFRHLELAHKSASAAAVAEPRELLGGGDCPNGQACMIKMALGILSIPAAFVAIRTWTSISPQRNWMTC